MPPKRMRNDSLSSSSDEVVDDSVPPEGYKRRPFCMWTCPCRPKGWVYREYGLFRRHCDTAHAGEPASVFSNLSGEQSMARKMQLAAMYARQPKATPIRRRKSHPFRTKAVLSDTSDSEPDAPAAPEPLMTARARVKGALKRLSALDNTLGLPSPTPCVDGDGGRVPSAASTAVSSLAPSSASSASSRHKEHCANGLTGGKKKIGGSATNMRSIPPKGGRRRTDSSSSSADSAPPRTTAAGLDGESHSTRLPQRRSARLAYVLQNSSVGTQIKRRDTAQETDDGIEEDTNLFDRDVAHGHSMCDHGLARTAFCGECVSASLWDHQKSIAPISRMDIGEDDVGVDVVGFDDFGENHDEFAEQICLGSGEEMFVEGFFDLPDDFIGVCESHGEGECLVEGGLEVSTESEGKGECVGDGCTVDDGSPGGEGTPDGERVLPHAALVAPSLNVGMSPLFRGDDGTPSIVSTDCSVGACPPGPFVGAGMVGDDGFEQESRQEELGQL